MKQLSQVENEKAVMLAQAKFYREAWARRNLDERYGEGAAEFLAQAIEMFYA